MIFALTDELVFPDPELAEKDGLLAVGGDLRPERLILAYRQGIFPWYSEGQPILWYAPHKRFVLFPEKVKISRSMRQFMKKPEVTIKADCAFEKVIEACSRIPREGQPGTWITTDMKQAYIRLHQMGIAHSIETYVDGNLAGGLYGVQTGRVFCGESMFSASPNASKAALIYLCTRFSYSLIDCQVYSEHLESMGAEFIPSARYREYLAQIMQ
jgi:leucyl/phenylalanyl-tRNA--protein transferase